MPTLQETPHAPGAVAADDVTVTLELWDGTPADGVAAGVRIAGPAYAYGASWSTPNVGANTAIDLAAGDAAGTLDLWDGTPGDGVAAGVRRGGPAYAGGAAWSIPNVAAHTAIGPAATVYRVTRTWPGLDDPLVDYISMPASGGPYR